MTDFALQNLYRPGGSAKEREIQEDTNSAVVRQMVSQNNEQEIPLVADIGPLGNGTYRRLLGVWRHDMWLRDVMVVNATNAALDQAGSAIALRYADPSDFDFAGGPATPGTLFILSAFNTTNFPAKQGHFMDRIVAVPYAGLNRAGSPGVALAVSTKSQGFKVPAGKILYAEFVNGEGANHQVIITANMSPVDRIKLAPGGLELRAPHSTQTFHSKDRGNI